MGIQSREMFVERCVRNEHSVSIFPMGGYHHQYRDGIIGQNTVTIIMAIQVVVLIASKIRTIIIVQLKNLMAVAMST